jgi:hypothetical protein
MMSVLRVAFLVLGALPLPACRSRAPEAPPAATPTAPAAVEAPAPAVSVRSAPRALSESAAREDSARGRAGTGGLTDTVGAAGPQPSATGLLLVSDRTMGRSRSALVAGQVRARAATPSARRTAGPGWSLGARPATEADSIPQAAPVGAPTRARAIRPVAILVLADHRVDPGTGVEHTSSLMYGAGFEATTRGWLSVRGEISTGTLTSRQTGVRGRSVTDARLDVGVAAFPWLTLLAGGGLRVYKQDAQENWRFLRFGAEARFPLGGDALAGMVRFTLSPMVSRTTSVPSTLSPSFAMAAASGLQLTYRLLFVGLEYAIESYTFPSSGGATRLEEFSGLRLRLGLNLGW